MKADTRYIAVVYTDGTEFISPIRHGKIKEIVDLPRAKYQSESEDSAEMQAVEALFNQTGLRVLNDKLKHEGLFILNDDFEVDLYSKKVKKLPPKETLMSNEKFIRADTKKPVSRIKGHQYISFKDISKFTFSVGGLENVVEKIYAIDKEQAQEEID